MFSFRAVPAASLIFPASHIFPPHGCASTAAFRGTAHWIGPTSCSGLKIALWNRKFHFIQGSSLAELPQRSATGKSLSSTGATEEQCVCEQAQIKNYICKKPSNIYHF